MATTLALTDKQYNEQVKKAIRELLLDPEWVKGFVNNKGKPEKTWKLVGKNFETIVYKKRKGSGPYIYKSELYNTIHTLELFVSVVDELLKKKTITKKSGRTEYANIKKTRELLLKRIDVKNQENILKSE